jgi:hypothetical protein
MSASFTARGARFTRTFSWPAVLNAMLLAALLAIAALHAAGLAADAVAVIASPMELDYGEGIVWQQAALIPGPRAYAPLAHGAGFGLPFIVFHYPPLFHLVTRLVAVTIQPDMLAAGRLVASLSTFATPLLLAWLALLATPAPARRQVTPVLAILAFSLVFTAFAPVRIWGLVMRVDTLGIALGFAGLVAAALAQGRFWGTLAALLFCLAAVFTKQTMATFGVTVVLLSVLRRPGPAALATLGVGVIGAVMVLAMQAATGGGFLDNVMGANINRFSIRVAYWVFYRQGENVVAYSTMVAAALWLLRAMRGDGAGWRLLMTALRSGDVTTWRRGLVVVQLMLSCLVLLTLFKIGSTMNALLQLCGAGCVAMAIVGADLLAGPRRSWGAAILFAPVVFATAQQPARTMSGLISPDTLQQDAALVQRIHDAGQPVGSENMVLLMRAGAGVVFEPAIVTELAHLRRWDETPLVAMLRDHSFAFMITQDGGNDPTDRRTEAVNAALVEAYPRVTQLRPNLFLRERP